jgi:NADPH-dependent curcumin reductase CurA
MTTNHQIRLASRPSGLPTPANWQFTEEPVGDAPDGGVVVKVLQLSLDPAMRGWMNDARSYIPPVELGAVMRAGGVGRVVSSRHPGFAPGDAVAGGFGVQEYATIPADQVKRAGLAKIDLRAGTWPQWLNVLGMPGMTGYFGLMDVGQPKAGETLVVSGAAGAVGQTVVQLGKIKGMRVVGIAGGPEKCRWVVDELGFDACIDYKAVPAERRAAPSDGNPLGGQRPSAATERGGSPIRDGLKQHCPNGVDVYFDNVGGEILDAVLARLARGARIVICGAISQYNNVGAVQGPKNYLSLLVNRARMQGMVVFDYADRYPEAVAEMARYLRDGRMKSREDVVAGGIAAFPDTLLKLFNGDNFGKLVLQVSPDDA